MPYAIAEIEITQPLPQLVIPEGDRGIGLVVRRAGRPIGFVMQALPAQRMLAPAELSRLIGEHIDSQLLEDPQAAPTASGASAALPLVTVAICTKDHPQDLAICLDRLLGVRSAGPEALVGVLVVDNAPSDSQTKELVAARPGI